MYHRTDLDQRTIPEYREFVSNFSLDAFAQTFSGSFEAGINAAIECCDRYAEPGRVALNWESKTGASDIYTFEQLRDLSGQFANFLVSQGVKPGDRVAGLLPRIPEMLIVILGTWRAGAVYQPLLTAFGPKAIEYRVKASEARLVITDSNNRPKLDDVVDRPPVVTVRGRPVAHEASGDFDFYAELERHGTQFAPVMRTGDDPCMMLFTSGTTGAAKGVAVPHKALIAISMYMRYAVDLRPGEAFWNVADPGWAYGLYFGAIGPLLLGQATTFFDGPFTVDNAYRVIEKYRIGNLAGAPPAYRLMVAAGAEAAARLCGRLRVVSSAGEPLDPEVLDWFRAHLDCAINDHYGQTEIGMVLCNFQGLSHPLHPGSVGLPVPGYRLAVVDDEGKELQPGQQGTLAVDREASPLYYFPGYWRKETSAFVGKYYLTGDTVALTEDGSIAFVGRGDDIITSAGYRIEPFDVENCLLEHPAVMEAAVVGKPDPECTEIVKAFVVLRAGVDSGDSLAEELLQFVKRRLAAHAYPSEIQFVAELPKTPSGKIQRFLLRQQEAVGNA